MLRSDNTRTQQLRRLAEWALRVDATYLSEVSDIRLKVLVALLGDWLLTYVSRPEFDTRFTTSVALFLGASCG